MRKLAIACLSFSAAVFISNYILPYQLLFMSALLCMFIGLSLFLLRRKWLRAAVIGFLSLSFGFASFLIHFHTTSVPVNKLAGETMLLNGKLLEYPEVYDEYCRVRLLLETEGLPKVQMLLYDDSRALVDAEPGQRISFSAKLSPADTRYGEKYEYYNSRDIYLKGNSRSSIQLTDSTPSVFAFPARLGRIIEHRIESIFPHDTAVFMKSLMLGEKTELYENESMHLALSRAGLMHIVAVSGMHIAVLISFIQLLMGISKRSSVICLVIVWLFVFVTGASPSAVRAAIMQSMLLMAPLFRRENDPITSLSAALALILIYNPYAAASVSLQLSFGAMAGIILFAPKLSYIFGSVVDSNRSLRYVAGIVASSVSVMVFTVPLMAVHFGYVSLLSIVTNTLVLWAVSVCFCGGFAACILSVISGIGPFAAQLVSWPVRYILFISKLISSIPFSTVYLNTTSLICWLILSYGMFLLWCTGKTSTGRKILFPTLISALLLFCATSFSRINYSSGTGIITAIDVSQGQCISVYSGDKTILIDCGNSFSLDNAGEIAGAFLQSCGRNSVDVLLLTHLHADHANGVSMLMEMAEVKMLVVSDKVSDDDMLLDEILESARRHGTEVVFAAGDMMYEIGNVKTEIYSPKTNSSGNENCLFVKVSLDEYDMLVTGDSPSADEKEFIYEHDVDDIELLIVGHHGSRYSSCGEFIGSIGADTAIISTGYNNYGHPTYETLERLNAYGYNIYRTDLNGNIEIRIG